MLVSRPFLFLLTTAILTAHPMGNFSVSHYSRIEVGPSQVHIDYVLDLAEIPTLELTQKWSLGGNAPKSELELRAIQEARQWAKNLEIAVDGKRLTPRFESARLTVSDGAGNMPVYRIAAKLSAAAKPGQLRFRDPNYPDRTGWKEIVVRPAEGAVLRNSDAPSEDKSSALSAYPQDPTVAPPQMLAAQVGWSAPIRAAVAAPVAPPAQATQTSVTPPGSSAPGSVVRGDFLSQLLGRKDLTWGLILLGIAVAFVLGGTHALSPGHGKTMVAAYLVGAKGTFSHALILGGTVTFTHTISVFALGFVTLFLSQYILPQTLYPILGAISGVTIVWLGATLLYKRVHRLMHHHHAHSHGHADEHAHAAAAADSHSHADLHHHHHRDHDHPHTHDHDHGPGGHSHVPEGEISLGSLLALGASGGLVPCPTGLVLLLSSIAIGRIGLGLTLLTAFSAGLAVVLTGIGLLVVYAKQWLPESQKTASSPFFRIVPVFSALAILVIGLMMTAVSLGWIQPNRFIG
jgi:nickel/cobalt exporter